MEFGLEKFLSRAFFRRETAEEHLNLLAHGHTCMDLREEERASGQPISSHISRAHEKEKIRMDSCNALRELVRLRRYHNSA